MGRREDLVGMLKGLVRPATIVKPSRARRGAEPPVTATKFGGRPYAERGETWTRCGGCGEGVTFIFQCNLGECPHHRGAPELFTFFYCHRCGPWGELAEDQKDAWVVRRYATPSPERAAEIEDRSPAKTRTRACTARLTGVFTLPETSEIAAVSPDAWDLAETIHAEAPDEVYEAAAASMFGDEPGEGATQIGGFARWVLEPEAPECAACRRPMRLLAQIESEEEAGLNWGKKGSVYLFECGTHPEQVTMRLQSK